jgi:hypothetical protein
MPMHQPGPSILAPLLLGALLAACASTVELQPVAQTAPREQAQRIYEALLERDGRRPRRGAGTLSGFAEAPLQTVRELKALAASSGDQEGTARVKLAAAMASTGLYSKVRFENRPQDVAVRFRLIGKSDARSAHQGWNFLPVGLYEIWGERGGERVSEPREYEVIQTEIVIVLTGAGGHVQ